MMEPADRDRVFVADLAAERAGLGEANVMGFGWRPAANDAGLGGDELAMLLVAQANGLRRNASAWRGGLGQDDASRAGSSVGARKGFSTVEWASAAGECNCC